MSLLLPILSGGLWVLCFPKADLGWLAWAALAPLFWSFRRCGVKGAAGRGYLAGLVFYAGLMQWIYTTCRTAGLSVPLAGGAWLGLAAVMAAHWGLFGLGAGLFRSFYGDDVPAAALGALWVAVEWLSAYATTRFPWGLAGYTQWRNPLLLPTAGAFGVWGLSFLVITVNAALARASAGLRAAGSELLLTGALAGGFCFLGVALGPRGVRPAPDTPIAILQGNVDQYQKWDAGYEQRILTDYAELARAAGPAALVVWPESALPGWYDDARYSGWFEAVAAKSQTFQLAGVVTRTGGQARNAAVLVSPEGKTIGFYYKRQLVPFGETVPFDKWLGKYIPVLNELGHIAPGPDDQPPLRNFWGEFKVGICYEAIFPALFRQRAEQGSHVLVNLTNDGWYLDTPGPYQHFAMAVLRAAENRAYLIRAANTGVSAMVDPWGRVTYRSKIGERTVLQAKFSMKESEMAPSFFARYGELLPVLCLAGVAASLALGLAEKRAASGKKAPAPAA